MIVVGAGGMGSAATYQLSAKGLAVLAIEQFGLAHSRGSSHGQSRIVRQAYFESPDYVPLLRRAFDLWAGFPPSLRPVQTGCLVIGSSDSAMIGGTLQSASRWDIPIEMLSIRQMASRFPQFQLADDEVGVFEPGGGYVNPEGTVRWLLERARQNGAEVLLSTPALGWRADGDGVSVETDSQIYTAAKLVLTAGSWTPSLAINSALPLRIVRRVMHWFQPLGDPSQFAPATMPTYIFDLGVGDEIYGFPVADSEGTVKVGFHHRGGPANPNALQPAASQDEIAEMRGVLASRIPALDGSPVRSAGCMYTLTPDEQFVLGPLPAFDDRVVIAAGFSGHGFKFVPVVGEIITDLVTEGRSRQRIEFLSPSRFPGISP